MAIKAEQVQVYIDNGADLIPIHVWNKKIKGKERGKTPVDFDWTTRTYTPKQIKDTIRKGFNIGYRIGADDLIVDFDPRNYSGEPIEELIPELFGYFDMEEMLEDNMSVQTGSGGYHVYFKLPDECDYKLLKEILECYPGIEFKRKGRQVLCAGCKHPNGKYYKWVTKRKPRIIPQNVIDTISRLVKPKNADYSSGAGSLTGPQLYDLILANLNIEDYASNDTWFPLLCGAHHATDGEGIEEFVEWSLEDSFYSGDENTIRQRWDSLSEKDNNITIGTLIHELEKHGEDSANLKAVLTFSESVLDDLDSEDDFDADDMDDFDIGNVDDDIDVDDVYDDKPEDAGVDGAAVKMCRRVSPESNNEDIMKCMRLIKAANNLEQEQAIAILVSNKVLGKASIKRMLKDLDAKLLDDMGRILAEKMLKNVFNKGRHIMVPPNGIVYSYGGKYWSEMSDDFLGKIITQVWDKIKVKIDVPAQENTLVNQALSITRRLVATHKDKLHTTGAPKGIINCSNGELHILPNGGHTLHPHNYRSGLLSCLKVAYTPGADCPLFKRTLEDIFSNFKDGPDIIRHVGELLGYAAQPDKNIASWWLFRGPGGDGKSTILSILGGILGDAQIKTTTKMLSLNEDNGSNNHTTASLVGKLNLVIEELPAGYLLKDAGLKMLSESTKMSANPKHGREFSFMYSGTLIMCSNGFPATRDLSHGMQRRANIIPFNKQFTLDGKEDLHRVSNILNDKMEMSGVLNFMLEGLQRLRDRGRFLVPVSCKEAKDEWSGEANHAIRFMREALIKTKDSTDRVTLKEVYESYLVWCVNSHLKPKGRNTLKNDLAAMGFPIISGGGNAVRIYMIKLKPVRSEEFDIETDEEDWDE